MRRARQTRPRTLVRTVTAALALVLVAPSPGRRPRPPTSPHRRPASSPRSARSPSPPRATSPATASTSASRRPSRRWTRGGRSPRSPRSASTSPATPAPAAPSPTSAPPGSPPRSPAAGGCCPSRSVRRPRASRASRATRTTSRSRRAPTGGYATAAAQGSGRGRQERRRRDDVRHRRGQHDLVRPRGLQPARHPLPRVRPGLHVRVGHPDQGARLHRRLLLQRELGHQDARRRPHPAPRPVRPAGPHLDRPLGRRGQHLDDLHPRGRLAPRRPDEAVPRRPQRDVGRRHDQHRQQLHRPRRRLPAAPGGALPRHPARLLEVPRALRRPSAKSTRVKALQCLLTEQGTYSGPVNGSLRRRHDRRRRAPGRPPASSPRATPSRSGTGPRCSPPEPVRRSSAGRSTSRCTGSSGRSTRPAPGASGRPGVFDAKTEAAVRTYQSRLKIGVSGVATRQTWNKLQQGR